MKMILILGLIIAGVCPASAQQILDSLIGKWAVKEAYKNKRAMYPAGAIVFEPGGELRSLSSYFGTTTGFYRTDETRSVVYIEIDEITTAWVATIESNTLRLQTEGRKQRPKIVLVLVEEAKATGGL